MKYLILFILLSSNIYPQILVTRNIIPVVDNDSTKRENLFNDFDFSPEFARGSGSYNGDMDWSLKLIGFAEVYRFKNNMSLSFLLAHELNANPYNDIAFNPRKAIWEENIGIYHKLDNFAYSFGIFHRCKHDIDNTDPPRENEPDIESVIMNRVMILNGLNMSLLYNKRINNKIEYFSQIYGEYYIIKEDYKTPRYNFKSNFENLIASLRINSAITYNINKIIDLRLAYYLTTLLGEKSRNNKSLNINARAELSLTLKGKENQCDFFVSYENMFEDTIDIVPNPTKFRHVGIRLRPEIFK